MYLQYIYSGGKGGRTDQGLLLCGGAAVGLGAGVPEPCGVGGVLPGSAQFEGVSAGQSGASVVGTAAGQQRGAAGEAAEVDEQARGGVEGYVSVARARTAPCSGSLVSTPGGDGGGGGRGGAGAGGRHEAAPG